MTVPERGRFLFHSVLHSRRRNDSCPRKRYLTDDWEYMTKKLWFSMMALNESRAVARLEMIGALGLILMLAHEDDEAQTVWTERTAT